MKVDPEAESVPLALEGEAINLLVDSLVTALINARIYEASHPRLARSIEDVQNRLRQYRSNSGQESLVVSASRDFLIFRRRPLIGASVAAVRLLKVFAAWQSGGVEIRVDAGAEELARFFRLALQQPRDRETYEGLNRRLEGEGIVAARLLPPYRDRLGSSAEGAFRVPMQLYQSIVDVLQETTIRVCQGDTIDFGPVQTHAEEVLHRLNGAEGPMLNLARQDQYDAFTFGHSVRVAVLALNFARALTDDHGALIRVGSAAMLHDVGKSLIPFEILHSSKELTQEERDIMSQHSTLGAELLLDHYDSDPLAVAAAFGHHCGCVDHGHAENAEPPARQGGYPKLPHLHRLSLVTEIVKICDIYEALTATRPYKLPMTPTRAYRVLMSMHGHVHRPLLRRFIEVNGIWPIGQLVRLTTGELARVVAQTEELMLPVVDVVRTAEGDACDGYDSMVDLSTAAGDRERAIVEVASENLL